MAGIAGIIEFGGPEENDGLDAMVQCMMHEAFYASGKYSNKSLKLSAGWVAHAGTFADCMPIWNETHDICLIFCGENYDDPAVPAGLKARGHSFNPGDASYLVHFYEEIGIKFLEKLNGWFCGLLIDLKQQKAVLFNDRYGLGRIYFHENEREFFFSSEAKSLLKVLPNLRRLDFKGLGEFLSCGAVLQNRTLFPEIYLMPVGSAWTFSPGQK